MSGSKSKLVSSKELTAARNSMRLEELRELIEMRAGI
jgi:hypothetical protein